jgi:transglutaminase-like putative cysteine protease
MTPVASRTRIPRRSLLWLTAALLCLVPTFIGNIAGWAPLVFLCSLLAKFWMERTDRRLRSLPLKIVLALAVFGAVFLSYGSPREVEFGVTLLVGLASLKILESHTAKDFHVLIMVGWVLCLCAFVISQAFAVALCILGAFGLLVAALVQFHRRSAPGGPVWPPLVTTCKLFAQAVPIVVLLFFLFPRGSGVMRLRFLGTPSDSVGFSGQLTPGSVAAVATSDELAFRAEFPDGNMPPRQDLYWRGAVLWQGDGLNWDVGPGVGRVRPNEHRTGVPIRQRITIEPHAGRWLFALDRPLSAPPDVTLAPGRYLQSPRPVSSIRRYETLSSPDAGERSLHPRERTASLRPPSAVSSAVRALVQTFAGRRDDPRATVAAALKFFRTQGFVYSLSPGQYAGPDAIDDLLFRRKAGFCEHYAATFATLMRLAGIPSRVVVGYLGGQFNQYGDYILVRQSDAHAWCEVWFPDAGWTRVDPTSVIAPERLNLGSLRDMQTTSMRNEAASGRTGQNSSRLPAGGVLSEVRLAWDSVSYAWDSRVLSFDLDGQQEFFANIGFDGVPGLSQLLVIAAATALLLGGYAAFVLRKSQAEPDAVKRLYEAFCRKAAGLGVARFATEGPADFGLRAANLLPHDAQRIHRICGDYIALRYASKPATGAMQTFAAEVRAFTRGTSDRHARS